MSAPAPPSQGQAKYFRDFGEVLRRYGARDITGFRLNPSVQPVAVIDTVDLLSPYLPPIRAIGGGQVPIATATNYGTARLVCTQDTVLEALFTDSNTTTSRYLFIDQANGIAGTEWTQSGANQFVQNAGDPTQTPKNLVQVGSLNIAPNALGCVFITGYQITNRWFIPGGGVVYISAFAAGGATPAFACGFAWAERH